MLAVSHLCGVKTRDICMYFPLYTHLLLGKGWEWGGVFWDESDNALRFQIIQHHNTDSNSIGKHGTMASNYNVGSHKIGSGQRKAVISFTVPQCFEFFYIFHGLWV